MKNYIENNTCILTVDSFGGAITNFHLKDQAQINPLNFSFTKEQMPENNKNGAPYQGHFLCLGRWGAPSKGEIKAGMPNHGEACNISWQTKKENDKKLLMQTTARLEGLQIDRTVKLDETAAVFAVDETITNINTLGRMYTVVQHPTLAAPFLNQSTIVNCNAAIGFEQFQNDSSKQNSFSFPYVKDKKGNSINLKNPRTNYDSVFSFITDESSHFGWLSAYSPTHNLLLGYIWKRSDYPWIHLWQHWNKDTLLYRGLEFGTAGFHQPFKEILKSATQLFGVNTFEYIDAGESATKKYFSFIYKPANDFDELKNIKIIKNSIFLNTTKNTFELSTSFNIENELSK